MKDQRKRVAKRLASGLLAGALALGGLAISGGDVSARTPASPTTNRLSGADRYETAVAVARDLATAAGAPINGAVIASGESPNDALAGAALTDANRPMLLVKKDSVPSAVLDFLSDYKTNFATNSPTFFILGGTSAISDAVQTAITSAVTTTGDTTPPTIVRISGTDRYATAKAISDRAGVTTATDSLIIVNGQDGKWADALSAGMLSAELGWPIILTTSTGLEASAKAKIDAYLALAGSAKSFVIIGGSSAVPTSLEEYLVVTKSVPPANIDRLAGADRYATNQAVNNYIYGLGGFAGDNAALISGESPWDALSASAWSAGRNVHLLMTPAAGGNAGVATWAVVGSILANSGLGDNANLWVVGGRSAVSDAAKAGYIGASTSVNLTSTLTCSTRIQNAALVGANTPTANLTFSGRLSTPEANAFVAAPAGYIKEGTANVAYAVTDLSTIIRSLPSRQYYQVSLPAATAVGSTISFPGIVEGTALGALTPLRSAGASSCTYLTDANVPAVTLRALPASDQNFGATTSAGVRLILESNEAVSVTKSDGFVKINGVGVSNSALVTVSALNAGTYTRWLIQLPTLGALPPAATVNAGTVFAVSAAAVADANLNSPAAEPTATAAADGTPATATVSDISFTDGGSSVITQAPLRFTAAAFAASGSIWGAKGSAWTMTVTNQRGLVMPTLELDATNKVIKVTADVGYHTVNDIANVYALSGDTDWAVASSTGVGTATLTATITPASCQTAGGTCGISNVRLVVATDEPTFLSNAGVAASVNGIATGAVTVATTQVYAAANDSSTNAGYSKVLTFTTTRVGSGTLNLTAGTAAQGMNDLSGNQTTASLAFTVS